MAISMDYIKSGVVLIASRLDYKYQYILQCTECEECFYMLEPFIDHCTSHYNRTTSFDEHLFMEDIPDDYYEDGYNDDDDDMDDDDDDKDDDDDDDKDDDDDNNDDDYHAIKKSPTKDRILSIDPIANAEEEKDVSDNDDISNKDDSYRKSLEEDDDLSDVRDETEWATNKSVNDEVVAESEGNDGGGTSIFIQKFMTSKENVTALLDAYEKQPMLWNNKFAQQLINKTDRIKCMQQIATDLQNEMKMELSIKELAAVIAHLRLIYRVKLKRDHKNLKYHDAEKIAWLFERLKFLKPFLRSHAVAVLDSHPHDLGHEEILQLLGIYKRYTQLWNSDTMEFCCKSKRAEALVQMMKDIEIEMEMQVDERSLKKYLHDVHYRFSRQKRRYVGMLKTKETIFKYYDHIIYLYDHVGPFKCVPCQRILYSPLKFKAHMQQHGGSIGLHCPECNKGYPAAEAYKAHVRRHMNDLSEECKECGKQFLNISDLRLHVSVHSGAKPFFCDICEKSFRQAKQLCNHKRRHTKQFSHNCPLCAKGYYTKYALDLHMTTHSDIRNFPCPICGKAFKSKHYLHKHKFSHEECRNHLCLLCGRAYKSKSDLRAHLITHS